MQKIAVEDVENDPHPLRLNSVRRKLSDGLGCEQFAFVYYELEPGESFSGGLHAHHDQEEVFYVVEGTASFEYTLDRDEVEVDAGEAIRFPPGQFQHGRNSSDERLVALAFGAPGTSHDRTAVEWMTDCDSCGEVTIHGLHEPASESELVAYCTNCGHEHQAV